VVFNQLRTSCRAFSGLASPTPSRVTHIRLWINYRVKRSWKKKEYDGGAGRSCDDRRRRRAWQAVEVAVVDNNNSCTISVVEGPPTIAQPLHWLPVLLRHPTTVITVKCSVNAHALSPSVVCDRDQCTLSSSPHPVHTGRTDGQVAGVRLTREKFFALWRQRWSPFVRLSLFTSQSPDYASGTRSGYPWRAEQLGRVTPCKRLVYLPQMSTGAVPIRKSSVRLLRDITFIMIYTLCPLAVASCPNLTTCWH